MIKKLESRAKLLKDAHKKISEEIEALLDQRIKIAGAIEENLYMQKMYKGGKK